MGKRLLLQCPVSGLALHPLDMLSSPDPITLKAALSPLSHALTPTAPSSLPACLRACQTPRAADGRHSVRPSSGHVVSGVYLCGAAHWEGHTAREDRGEEGKRSLQQGEVKHSCGWRALQSSSKNYIMAALRLHL